MERADEVSHGRVVVEPVRTPGAEKRPKVCCRVERSLVLDLPRDEVGLIPKKCELRSRAGHRRDAAEELGGRLHVERVEKHRDGADAFERFEDARFNGRPALV